MHSLFFPNAVLPFESRLTHSSSDVDVFENEDGYLLELMVPGFDKEDFRISVSDRQIQIKAEKEAHTPEGFKHVQISDRHVKLDRTFRFRQSISAEEVEATVSNGVISLKVPKKTTERLITVKAS